EPLKPSVVPFHPNLKRVSYSSSCRFYCLFAVGIYRSQHHIATELLPGGGYSHLQRLPFGHCRLLKCSVAPCSCKGRTLTAGFILSRVSLRSGSYLQGSH